MAQESPLSATGALTEAQYERLAAPQCADGLIGHPSNPAPVTVSGGQVRVRAGLAGLLRGFPWASGDADTVYTPSLTGPARTDLVVLRLYRDQGYKVETAIRTGSPGAGAPVPYTDTGPTDWHEIPLAEYDVANGAFGAVRRRAWYIGDDGQILCRSDSRPPHQAGRRIREVDTGRAYESNGSRWVTLLDDSGPLTHLAVANWTYSKRYLRRFNGMVTSQVSARRSGAIPGSTQQLIATLPPGTVPDTALETTAFITGAGNGSGPYSTWAEYRTNGMIVADLSRGIASGAWVITAPATFVPTA
ncbi:hypothetical protein DER29_0484 [Micromonospora sp. M71_S20]|uniref:hypothetical protein n=1 Tax=Micromonospora sp. M71_S20 TaxID=592872 RepID=UPI000EB09121|nr:hypothetical protein [Micromonospora sp. M71_S20]RLK22646.1 hypothetical protein DER29_0484 [Micromonospora sp. M71_S20]